MEQLVLNIVPPVVCLGSSYNTLFAHLFQKRFNRNHFNSKSSIIAAIPYTKSQLYWVFCFWE